ncbi:MAG: glycosyltransferase family 39 protein [Patescibacteria group bacterium]|jgi:4-amino-4-deoxy-L-arabinose transferase-like glycosyltransferase
MAETNKNFWQKNEKKILWLIIILAVILRFWNISTFDVMVDHALYSVRALGWFDYLGGGQTAPVQWFGTIPAWALLSFHDCPPLVFFIQKIFFSILGDNTFASRLPHALAGILSVLLVYLSVKKIKSVQAALWSAVVMAVSSYAVWASYAGYLEGVEVLFIVLSLYFFICYLADGKNKNLYWWAAAAGLAFLSKYTSVFLLPVGLLCLLGLNYRALKNSWQKIFYSLLIFLGVISPVIFYNIMVFKYRGHFDASLSAMVGMHPQDYSAIAVRVVNANIIGNFSNLINCFPLGSSWPLVAIFILALTYLLFKTIRGRSGKAEIFILANVLAAGLMFCFGEPAYRQVSIFIPFLVIVAAILFADLSVYLSGKKYHLGGVFKLLALAVLVAEFGYCVNTNILLKSWGSAPWFSSSQRLASNGWNELEIYWRDNLLPPVMDRQKIRRLEEMPLSSRDFSGKNVIFYDDNVNWFSSMWYIEKYPLYYRVPLLPLSYLLNQPQALEQFRSFGAKDFYYVSIVNPQATDPVVSKNESLMKAIEQLNAKLVEDKIGFVEIKNAEGEAAFRIYKLNY